MNTAERKETMNNELEHDDDDLAADREPNTQVVREPNTEFAREPNTREPNTGITEAEDDKA